MVIILDLVFAHIITSPVVAAVGCRVTITVEKKTANNKHLSTASAGSRSSILVCLWQRSVVVHLGLGLKRCFGNSDPLSHFLKCFPETGEGMALVKL